MLWTDKYLGNTAPISTRITKGRHQWHILPLPKQFPQRRLGASSYWDPRATPGTSAHQAVFLCSIQNMADGDNDDPDSKNELESRKGIGWEETCIGLWTRSTVKEVSEGKGSKICNGISWVKLSKVLEENLILSLHNPVWFARRHWFLFYVPLSLSLSLSLSRFCWLGIRFWICFWDSWRPYQIEQRRWRSLRRPATFLAILAFVMHVIGSPQWSTPDRL